MAEPLPMDDAAAPRRPLATGGAILAYALGLAVVALDQAVKQWVLFGLDLEHRPPIRVLPFLDLNMVWNQGVSYGLLKADSDAGRWGLVLFALVMTLILAHVARGVRRPLMILILGLIMGGAVGNLIDRIRFGAVADFLDVHAALGFPYVFNVADSAISIGVALFILDSLFGRRDGRPPSAA